MTFNPNEDACRNFSSMFGSPEITPLGQAGNSHFGYVKPGNIYSKNPGWHVTTQIPGFGKAEGLSNGLRIHDFFDNN